MKALACCFAVVAALSVVLSPMNASAETAVAAPDKKALEASAAASLTWLGLLDRGDYGKSWDTASAIMKLTLPKDQWITILNKVRKPLGSVRSRTVLDQRTAKDPHGLPKGDYMVMFYKTVFSSKTANELVTLYFEEGTWSVLTYQVN